MLLLARVLPFIVGPKIPEDEVHWKCFLLLRQIMDIVLCPFASESMSVSLKFLIDEHHRIFVSLYSKCIPKMHFLIHYPEQMLAMGPMTKSWTMRHEAKLNFFKQLTKVDNFKNIAFSMANRHQRWICYQLACGTLLSTPVECGPGLGPIQVIDEAPDIQEGLSKLMEISPNSTVFHPRWVRKDGIVYKDNVFLITGSDGLDPVFVQLDELLVIGGDMIVFIVYPCTTLFFDSHYHAYVIDINYQRTLVLNLADPHVLHGRKINGCTLCWTEVFFLIINC